jgi:hypothetical protein
MLISRTQPPLILLLKKLRPIVPRHGSNGSVAMLTKSVIERNRYAVGWHFLILSA